MLCIGKFIAVSLSAENEALKRLWPDFYSWDCGWISWTLLGKDLLDLDLSTFWRPTFSPLSKEIILAQVFIKKNVLKGAETVENSKNTVLCF